MDEDAMTRLPVQETSDAGQANAIILHTAGDDQTPFSKEESSHISLDKMQDGKRKIDDVSIMDETMSPTLSCKPQEEDDRPRAEEEQNALYIADDTDIETKYRTAMSQGSEDNSVHFALDDNDAEGGRPGKNANASSRDNNVSSEDTELDRDNNISAEATEPDSDNNYGHRKGVSSCQLLENPENTFMDGNMDTNSSWDTKPEGGFPFGSQSHTNDTINREPYEDILERQNAVAAEIIESMTIASSISALDGNSVNFALDDNDAIGSRLGESANSHIGEVTVSPEGTKEDYHNNHGNGMSFCSSRMTEKYNSMGDKMGNSPLLDTRPRDSSSFTSWPLPNVTVDSGLHEDTLEGQVPVIGLGNYTADNASVVGTFEVDKTKSNDNLEDEDNCPRSSKTEGERNAQECKNINFTVDSRLHEDALESQKTIFGSPESHAKDMDLMLSTSEMNKTKNENVCCEFQTEKGTGPSKTKQEQIEMDEPNNVIISSESQDKKSPRVSKTKQDQHAQESENINISVDRRQHEDVLERQKPLVGGPDFHVKDKALMISTSELDKTKNNNISCKFQDRRRSRASKTKQEQIQIDEPKNIFISCESQDKKGPRASTPKPDQNAQESENINITVDRRQHEDVLERQKPLVGGPDSHVKDMALMLGTFELDKTKNNNISCKFQGKRRSRASKTEQNQNATNESKGENKSCESRDKKEPRASKTKVHGNETDGPKGENISCESQDKKGPRASKTGQYRNKTDGPKGENISCESQDKKGPRASKTGQYRNKTDGPKGENISCESQDKKEPRASKTGQERNGLNVGTETKYIASSSQESKRSLTHFGDTVVDRLDNSGNEGSRDNNCPEDTEVDKKKNSGHGIGIGSNQNLINSNSMGDKMDTSCSLSSRSKETSSVSNQSNASTTEDNELHEDTLIGQKPVVRGLERLIADKTGTDLKLAHNVSEDRDLKIRNANPDIFLGNEVDSNASETQEIANPPSASNQLDSNCSSTSGTLREARECRKTTRDKTSGALRPKRGGKAFKEHNPENGTPEAYASEKETNAFNANGFKEKMSIMKTSQSNQSTIPVRLNILAVGGKWCLATLCLFIYSISTTVQAPPLVELAKWQQWWLCTDGDHLYNQTLGIKNLERITDQGCSFEAPDVPYYYNCSTMKALVILINTTCLEMLTAGNRNQQWIGEYGAGYNGESLKTTRGELLSNEEAMDKVGRYTSGDGPQAGSHNQSTTTPGQANKPPDILTWLLILLCTLVAILALLALGAYCICKRRANTDQPPTANGTELQTNGTDGNETSQSLLSNGTSEH